MKLRNKDRDKMLNKKDFDSEELNGLIGFIVIYYLMIHSQTSIQLSAVNYKPETS